MASSACRRSAERWYSSSSVIEEKCATKAMSAARPPRPKPCIFSPLTKRAGPREPTLLAASSATARRAASICVAGTPSFHLNSTTWLTPAAEAKPSAASPLATSVPRKCSSSTLIADAYSCEYSSAVPELRRMPRM